MDSYNIFKKVNMFAQRNRAPSKKIANILHALGLPARLRILQAIGLGEACVCHLEACLGMRQAYISQHLMAMRQSGIVTTRREGRNVYYRIKDPAIFDLIRSAGQVAGIQGMEIQYAGPEDRVPECICPHCNPAELQSELVPDQNCSPQSTIFESLILDQRRNV